MSMMADTGADKTNYEDAIEEFERPFGTGRGPEKAFQFEDVANWLGGVVGDGLGGGGRNGLGFGSRRADHHSRELALHPPPQDTVRTLRLSLEELFAGGVKRIHVNRKLRNGQSEPITRDFIFKAGSKSGTKIRYEGLGHEDQHGRAGGLVLVVAEAPHERFKREGDDLVYTHVVPLREALAGPEPAQDVTRGLVHLDGRPVVFSLPFIHPAGSPPISPGLQILIPNRGMPIIANKNAPIKPTGDLRIIITVEFPTWLDAHQILAARQLK
ncbi:hypothetical protein PCANC_05652 [Puccinia coronata f. sp. avenae]|uniref:Chaperone DnaJ C-terminal domain-containing protein n=1 Tax=Puccinia coronata f. sp. avenae TaxID=200324 RepID=A0A2N5U9N5_9BASI|nr:hypothetical protein PCASD_15158 [Puccinia coronata f. sp. avenae]PLW54818.1 hypothetical protein PCANC_05652 [Puccinia coronata f. sp. avenae]